MSTPKKQGRPKGTTKRAKTAPDSVQSAIVRAIFPAGFPVGLGWHLYDIRSTRARVKDIKSKRLILPDIVVMEGMHPEGREVSRITMLDSMTEHREELEQEFELECTLALLRGESDYFEKVAQGVAALESFSKAKLAVADAWYYLTRWEKIHPTAGKVANHANTLTADYITASQARDYLRSMGMIGGN